MTAESGAPHLTAMAHHGLEAVLCVQVPPLHESVLRAVQRQSTHTHTDTHFVHSSADLVLISENPTRMLSMLLNLMA